MNKRLQSRLSQSPERTFLRATIWSIVTFCLCLIAVPPAWSWVVTFDWGSFPDYLAGLGAVAALIWARKAAKAAKAANERQDKQLQILIDDKREQEEDKRKGQAELVNAWFRSHGEKGEAPFTIVIANLSSAPVSSVVVTFETQLYADDGRVVIRAGRPVIPPVKQRDYTIALQSRTLHNVKHYLKAGSVNFAFTDSAGNHWERHADGRLERHDEPMIWWGDDITETVYIEPYPDNINRHIIDMLTRVDVETDHKGNPVNITIRER